MTEIDLSFNALRLGIEAIIAPDAKARFLEVERNNGDWSCGSQ